MKGSAKIELRDAKSGRLVKQIEKHNLVTKGASNAMKLELAYTGSIGDYGPSRTLIEKYFGGILLFGASIDESSENTILSEEERASYIGHASCSHTITGDSLMGTYVAGESSVDAHKATLVFSFDTSQANGNINCICLTSAEGGEFGFGVTALTSTDTENIAESFKMFRETRFNYWADFYPIVFKFRKSYNYCDDNKVYVSDFTSAKNLGLNLSIKGSDLPYWSYSKADPYTQIQATYNISMQSIYWSLDENRVVCGVSNKNEADGSKNIVEFEVIEIGETTSSKITLDYTNMVADLKQKAGEHFDINSGWFEPDSKTWALYDDYALNIKKYDNKYYLCIANMSEGTYAVKQLETKALAKPFGDTITYDGVFANILDTIYLKGDHKEASACLYYKIDLDTAEVADIPEFYTKSWYRKIHTILDDNLPPIIDSDTMSGIFCPYLATINNVDTLEKNASRTLKITYNLEY